jgi:N,N-dimethylformamidase beta subunit-like protein
MTTGYPGVPSLFPGETLLFHVSTDAPQIRIELYRQGATLELKARSPWFPGKRSPDLAPWEDWSTSFAAQLFPIPGDTPPGVYIAMFIEGDEDGNELKSQQIDRTIADGRSGKALFVLRNPHPGDGAAILYKLPFFTYCAYNSAGDPSGSLYTGPRRKVTFHRPGNGTGGTPWDAAVVDYYDRASPRQTFAHWDEKMIRWLEGNGIPVDYATDLDVHHNDGDFLSAYALVLSVGHDEYWSARLRANLETFVAEGGNLALFSGNVCWWRVTLEDDETAIACDKTVRPGETVAPGHWFPALPENTITGVSYRNAGGQWNGPRPSGGGYTVRRSQSWVFAGTGLKNGGVFGEKVAVVGYECDGAAFTLGPDGVPTPTGEDGTPLGFVIVATSSVAGWEGAEIGALASATMGYHEKGGTVFTSATVDWPRALEQGDAEVDRITRNVIDRLSRRRA